MGRDCLRSSLECKQSQGCCSGMFSSYPTVRAGIQSNVGAAPVLRSQGRNGSMMGLLGA